tara:strand:- start:814 stop:1605 length:792 start_codon:yes stop_codon:yes gene_type:complete
MAGGQGLDWSSIWEGIQHEQNEGALKGMDLFKNIDNSWKGVLPDIKTAFENPDDFGIHVASQFKGEGGSLASGDFGEVGKLLGTGIGQVGELVGGLSAAAAGIGHKLDLSGNISGTSGGKNIADMGTHAFHEGGNFLDKVTHEFSSLGGNINEWYHGDEDSVGFGETSGMYDWDAPSWAGQGGIGSDLDFTPSTSSSGATTDEAGTQTDNTDDAEVTEEEYEELVKDPREQALQAQRRARIRRGLANKSGKRSTIRTSGRGIL